MAPGHHATVSLPNPVPPQATPGAMEQGREGAAEVGEVPEVVEVVDEEEARALTRSALGPAAGETSSEGPDRDSLNSGGSRRGEEEEYRDDLDDEITAVFAEGEEEDGMSKSWHGSRSASQKSLSFFVDISTGSPGPPPALTRCQGGQGTGDARVVARMWPGDGWEVAG